jgi:hypothetical protein
MREVEEPDAENADAQMDVRFLAVEEVGETIPDVIDVVVQRRAQDHTARVRDIQRLSSFRDPSGDQAT